MIWGCKIGEADELPDGSDAPMREAVIRAYKLMTGKEPEFTFSGWGASLDETERAVVENRLPEKDPDWNTRQQKDRRIRNERRSKYV